MAGFPSGSLAQARTDSSSPERHFPHDFLEDQKAIWTSPAHVKGHDLKWFLPFAAVTAGLIVTDTHSAKVLNSADADDISFSHGIANVGLGSMAGAVAVSYLVGHLAHNRYAVKSGVLGGEAIADSALVVSLLKVATNRRRPNVPGADGDFWSGGNSFPSGHTIMTWATASVIAERYRDKPLLKFGVYGVAAAVSVSRVTGQDHYPSDIAVGAVFGYLIGHYVVKHHGAP